MATLTPLHGQSNKKPRKIYYPTEDGKPMAETLEHRVLMFYSIPALTLHFANRPDVYVSGNDFLYYAEGVPASRISPDCYVVIGVEKDKKRKFYKVWEENGVVPAVVFEFTSKKTRKEDEGKKRTIYETILRVPEYFQFDPTGDYLKPRLQGKRLHEGQYVDIALQNDRMYSEQLRLDLVMEGEHLRFYDPVEGVWLLSMEEHVQRAEDATQRAAMEAQRAETETQRAKAEAQRAETAEAELARLRAELEALRQQMP